MSDGTQPDWLTEVDREILGVLNMNLTLSPSIIAENIDRSRSSVSRRLSTLTAGGLVEKVDRGMYQITKDGSDLITDERIVDIPDPKNDMSEE